MQRTKINQDNIEEEKNAGVYSIKYQVYYKLQYLKQWGISKRIEHVRREPAKKKKKKI